MGVIYCIENTLTGMKYIGQTRRTLNVRISEHFSKNCSSKCTRLYNSIQKYGKEYFTFKCLHECENSKLDEMEEKYIIEYNTLHPYGYNLREGGGTGTHNDETKNNISIKSLKMWSEKGQQLKAERRERGTSQETKNKISKSIKELFDKNPDIKLKISEAGKGRVTSLETRLKQSESGKRRWKLLKSDSLNLIYTDILKLRHILLALPFAAAAHTREECSLNRESVT